MSHLSTPDRPAPARLREITLLMLALNTGGLAMVSAGPATDTSAATAIIIATYPIVVAFWRGHGWARIAVIAASLLCLANLVLVPFVEPLWQLSIVAEAVFAVYLLRWTRRPDVRAYFVAPPKERGPAPTLDARQRAQHIVRATVVALTGHQLVLVAIRAGEGAALGGDAVYIGLLGLVLWPLWRGAAWARWLLVGLFASLSCFAISQGLFAWSSLVPAGIVGVLATPWVGAHFRKDPVG